MNMRQMFGSLACGAVLLAGTAACSDDPQPQPTPTPTNRAAETAVEGIESNDPDALLEAGVEHGQAGRIDEARSAFERVIELQDDNKFAWFNLGYIAQTRDDVDAAIENYDKALDVDAAYRPALYNKALLLEASASDDAVALYEKIVAADESASTAYLRLGLLRVRGGDEDQARQAFKAAIALDSRLVSEVPEKFRPATSGG